MIVLVDTSVWMRFFSNVAPYASGLDELLTTGDVAGHDFVFGELQMGDRGGRRQFLADYALMYQAAIVPHSDVVEFVRHRRLHGRGIGWIDAHLAIIPIMRVTRRA